MNVFFELHKDIPREGPGDNASTKKALQMLEDLPLKANILDIGCGPGMQTFELARNIDGKILAMDVHEPFLEEINKTARQNGLAEKVTTKNMSMFALDFQEATFDVIWCEGAIFIIGFEKGIKEWRKYIKEEGYLVVSEISWLKNDRPEDVKTFWDAAYPTMKSIPENIKVIEDNGYTLMAHFTIPEDAWWQNYYTPLLGRIDMLKEKYADNQEAINQLDGTLEEIHTYKKYSDCYGYVFYVMKKK